MKRYIVSFVPIGSESKNSNDIAFYLDSTNIDSIKSKAYDVAQDEIDPYALRNHWEIDTIDMF